MIDDEDTVDNSYPAYVSSSDPTIKTSPQVEPDFNWDDPLEGKINIASSGYHKGIVNLMVELQNRFSIPCDEMAEHKSNRYFLYICEEFLNSKNKQRIIDFCEGYCIGFDCAVEG